MPLAARTRLGACEIGSLIGAGGMGEVYKARDKQLRRDVALNILPSKSLSIPSASPPFEREAQALAALNQPHIAYVHGFVKESRRAPGRDGARQETATTSSLPASSEWP